MGHSPTALPTERIERLQALTVELAGALTSERVAEVIIDHGVSTVGAATGAIWLIEPGGTTARMLRQAGFPQEAAERFAVLTLDGVAPLSDAIRRRQNVLLESSDEYARRFPASHERVGALLEPSVGAIACLPLVAAGQTIGGVMFAFAESHRFDANEVAFLSLLAHHCAEGVHRSRVYGAERDARAEMTALYALFDALSRADTVEDVFEPALDGVTRLLNVARAAILLYDTRGVLRFRAFRGLSESYRNAVEGHSPWPRNAKDPQPIVIADVACDSDLAAYREVLDREGIRALCFVPLVHGQRLLGKFMLYANAPRNFDAHEIGLARTIATQIALIVARRTAESEMQRAYAAAELASRMKDEFLAIVSHELRTPLSAIAGWAAMLKSGRASDAATLAKGLDVIDRNAKSQAKIIGDILDVSRIITGKLVLDPKPVNAVTIAREALDSVRASAQAREITLSFNPAQDDCSVVGDPERLRQIAWNLLSNAIKFTKPGGRVTLRLRSDQGGVLLEVEDSGRGIDPELLPHVFDRFRQGDSSTTRQQGGLGLGLSIVRHLVELHGGWVSAESAGSDCGATFTVRFPRVPPAMQLAAHDAELRPAGEIEPPSNKVDLSGVRVLVVDDEPDARDLIGEILASFGASVHTADSARSALEDLPGVRPDVLVSDIGMPGEDGYALVQKLRSLSDPWCRLPAIALTAYAREEDKARALDAGFQEYLIKPAKPAVLAELVFHTHRSARGRAELAPASH